LGFGPPAAGVVGWGLVVEGLVGSVVVVFQPPVFDEQLCFVEGVEAFHVQQFASEVAV